MLLDLERAAFAVVSHMSAAGLKEKEGGVMQEEGGGASLWAHLYLRLSSEAVVKAFSSAKHINAINLYKSFLRSVSLYFSLTLSFAPLSQSRWSGQGLTLVWPLSLSLGHWMETRPAFAAARGSCIIFMSLAAVQGLIFIPALIERCISGAGLLT